MKGKQRLIRACNVLLILAVFVGAIFISRNRVPIAEGISKYTTADVVFSDGRAAHFENKNFGTVSRGDVVTLHIALPEKASAPASTLVFYDYSTITEVWWGGQLLDSHGEDSAALGRIIGNHAFFVDIPSGAWGNEITIILRPTENNAFTDFPQLKMYPSQNANQWFVDNDAVGFVLTIALFVFSIFGALACILGEVRGATLKNGLYLVLLAFLVSLWLFSNRMMYSLFRWDFYFWEPLEYITGFTIAIPVTLFYRGMAGRSTVWRKILGWSAAAVALFFVIATVLNFTNVLHYSAFTIVSSMLLAASSLLLLVYSFMTRGDRGKAKRLLRTGSYIFVLTCLYELLLRSLVQYLSLPFLYNLPTLITVGIMFLVLCMIGAFISDLYEKQKELLTVQIKADMLHQVIAETPAGICQLRPDDALTIVSANDIFYEIIGYRENELKSSRPKDLFAHLTAGGRAFVNKKVEQLLRGSGTTGEFEFSAADKDNRPLTLSVRYCHDRDGSGNITVNIVDITDRKRMEEELRISEARYKLALGQSGKVFFFFDVSTRTMQLSQELADAFGLPLKVDNMPDNFLSQGLVEPESVESYRHFYERILAGEKSGEAVISCHMPQAPENALWYKIAFTTVFSQDSRPVSTIITYEDLQEQRAREIEGSWKQLSLLSVPQSRYAIAEYDLTRDRLLSQKGGLFATLPEFLNSYDDIVSFVLERFVYEEDVPAYRRFLDRARVLAMFSTGQTEDSIEYRALQSGSTPRWTSTSIQMIRDPYSGNVLAQLLFLDIHEEKSG